VTSVILIVVTALLAAEAWVPRPPLGLDLYLPAPVTNPLTREKVALGRRLFFDKRLSRDATLSCASCHDPERAFSDGRAVARGINGAEGTRNAPALINRGYGRAFFWDGSADSLEQQVLQPIFNASELGLTQPELERRTGMKSADISAALASYVRTIRSGDSRFDRYIAGRTASLNALEKAGLAVFRGKGSCTACHFGSNFTDERFHNTGVAWRDGRLADEGRFTISSNPRDHGAFKTPTLREIARTAPYMHDGSLATLEDVVEFYSDGGRPNPNLDPEIRRRSLDQEEKRALIAFLKTLSGRVHEEFR
jgi:cytochrome c peroxidase